jgi:hypothetical protein
VESSGRKVKRKQEVRRDQRRTPLAQINRPELFGLLGLLACRHDALPASLSVSWRHALTRFMAWRKGE